MQPILLHTCFLALNSMKMCALNLRGRGLESAEKREKS
ncbi:hypothetical protein HAL07_13320 [Helicobacter ailurogastricus]|uniref:Uncharacterized protein n=1 Tax=Helicobacter ailurogastricus TaxID=1578720 RepID=A0A0K2Y3I0_9HELI|nr:hypothetical protein HAL07_13320 [Helicobacter ailurogastricus]